MPLPDFIIGGAQKSGTTTLLRQLSKHPSIYMPEKEVNYFESSDEELVGKYERGLSWYSDLFPDNGCVCGEKSPNYLYNPCVPERIYDNIPDVKLVFILRDPVKRAYSQYWMRYRCRALVENNSFKDAVTDRGCEYLDRGMYWRQLKRYLDVFPREQVHVIVLKDLIDDPKSVYMRLYDFLGIDHVFPSNPGEVYYKGGEPRFHWIGMIRHGVTYTADRTRNRMFERVLWKLAYVIDDFNVKGQLVEKLTGRSVKKYHPMNPDVARELYEYYRPHNERLLELYPGLPIKHWMNGGVT